MSDEREIVDDEICDLMIKHGPDGHIDGHDLITDYAMRLVAAEREACAKIADDNSCEQCWVIAEAIRARGEK